MTAVAPPALRTVAFGEQEPGVWGAVLSMRHQSFVVLGSGADVSASAGELMGGDAEGDWILRAAGVELRLLGDRARSVKSEDGLDQACRASGSLTLEGREHLVDCDGYRGMRAADGELDRCESIRAVAGVFENGEAIALTALRPHRAKGHGADSIRAAVLAADGAVAVDDPRLSTTYDAESRPSRASLELWVGEREDEQQRVRRVAGEALGPAASGSLGALRATGQLFRWHSRGASGVGVYLLAR